MVTSARPSTAHYSDVLDGEGGLGGLCLLNSFWKSVKDLLRFVTELIVFVLRWKATICRFKFL